MSITTTNIQVPSESITNCIQHYQSPALNLTGFVLALAISKCYKGESFGDVRGRGFDEFIMIVVNEYFGDSKQVVVLYDESWEIDDMILRLGSTVSKSFVLYFLPLDPELAKRIHSKPPDHISHKFLPKGSSFVIFVKDVDGFINIIDLISKYPWWSTRAKCLVMLKTNDIGTTKGILSSFETERIYNGVVVTEITGRQTVIEGLDDDMLNETNEEGILAASLQIAAYDAYPSPGQPKHIFIGKYANAKLKTTRPIFLDRIENLQGTKLKACVVEYPPMVIKTKIKEDEWKYSGLEITIMNELGKYMNFTYEVYETKEGERFGVDLGNGSWNGLIGEVAEYKADLGFGSVFLVDKRESVVDISDPYDQDMGCFAVPSPEALQHWLGLVLPFSWQVWCCFISMALIAGPIFSFLTRPLKMDGTLSVGRGIMYALGSLVSAQHAPEAKSSALRSFIISWLIFCWLSAILYRVALIVSLTLGPSDYQIDTIEQLARSGLEWGGYNETSSIFTNTSDKTDIKLIEKFIPLTNITAGLDRTAKEGDFAVLDSGKFLRYQAQTQYFDGYSSLLHVAKECPTTYNVGFIMPIGSAYYEKINQLLRRFQNAGLIDKWYENAMYESFLRNPSLKSKGEKSYGLTINHLKLAFVLVLFGHFFGFVSCMVEKWLHRRRERQQQNRCRKNSQFSLCTVNSVTGRINEEEDEVEDDIVKPKLEYKSPVCSPTIKVVGKSIKEE